MFHQDSRNLSGFAPSLSRAPAELTEEEKKKGAQLSRSQCGSGVNSTCGGGCASCLRSVALMRAGHNVADPDRVSRTLLSLQRDYGNRHVLRLVSRAGAGGAEAGPEVEEAIQQKRGEGQPLDSGVRRQMETSLQADFSHVRIHDNAHADGLNRALSARAFTTGSDIFFSAGSYRPGTSGGRELLAHELTHVVQQTGDGIRTKMTVSQPGDALEHEADQVAKSVIQSEHQTPVNPALLQRQLEKPEEEKKEKKKLLGL